MLVLKIILDSNMLEYLNNVLAKDIITDKLINYDVPINHSGFYKTPSTMYCGYKISYNKIIVNNTYNFKITDIYICASKLIENEEQTDLIKNLIQEFLQNKYYIDKLEFKLKNSQTTYINNNKCVEHYYEISELVLKEL